MAVGIRSVVIAVATLAGDAVGNNMRLCPVSGRLDMAQKADLLSRYFQQTIILAAVWIMTLDASGTFKTIGAVGLVLEWKGTALLRVASLAGTIEIVGDIMILTLGHVVAT